MTTPIDFYVDFSSPYAYLAAARIDALAARYGRRVRWHPVLLVALSETTGVKLTPFVPIKWAYAQKDLVRQAKRLGLPLCWPPNFPQLWLMPGRAMLWIRERHGEDVAHQFARACFHAAFGEGRDLNVPSELNEIAAPLGVDAEALAAGLNSEPIKQAFKDAIAQAIERGVFGVPFIIADGESFWGGDRFDALEDCLKNANTTA